MDMFCVNDLLAQDLLARNDASVRENDLIPLEALTKKKWNYDLPTFCNRFYNGSKLITKSFRVIRNFLKEYECFRNVDMSNILIAGGSVSNMIIGRQDHSDVDLFIYGIGVDELEKRIEKLVRDLQLPKRGRIMKSNFATTISFKDKNHFTEIQIVHRLYNTPSEVLHGFDMGSCSVGILLNEKRVVTTSLGKASLEYEINILDLSKRSLNYEDRLIKYLYRGFRIVMPDLNMKEVGSRHSRVWLKTLSFEISKVKGNRIYCFNVVVANRREQPSDYDPFLHFSECTDRYNTLCLYSGKDLIYDKEWNGRDDLISSLADHVIDIGEVPRNLCNVFRSGEIRYKRLTYYLGDEIANSLVQNVLSGKDKEAIEKEAYGYFKARVSSYLQAYNEYGGYKAKWVTVNPASQITGSFRPAVISKKEFYGAYLKE